MPTMTMLVSTNYGLVAYGTIFGAVFMAQNIGNAVGPLTAGYMFDAIGDYRLAFTILLSLYVLAIPVILLVRRPKSG